MKRRSRDRRAIDQMVSKKGVKRGSSCEERGGAVGGRRQAGNLTEVRSRNELAARMSDMSDADSGGRSCAVSQCHELLTCTTHNSTQSHKLPLPPVSF